MTVRHHLSVDVEEYFQASAMESFLPREGWDGLDRRSPELVARILDVLSEAGVEATFFVLGWLAKREPQIVRDIAASGHEVSSHGWDHQRVTSLSPEEFRDQVRRSRALLQDLSGQPVLGFRAPSFSIVPGHEWALDVLVEEGYLYDSSLFPVEMHPDYGYSGVERDPHVFPGTGGALAEIPPATVRLGGRNFPAAGGAYLRFFPLALIRNALTSAERRGMPGTLYLHPWELDEAMPALPASRMTRLRMRGGIGTVARKLTTLTSVFTFQTMIRTARRTLASVEEATA